MALGDSSPILFIAVRALFDMAIIEASRHRERRGDMSVMHEYGEAADEPWLVLGGQAFRSRLIVGIEQYESVSQVRRILKASGCDVFITTIYLDQQRSRLLLAEQSGR